MKKMSDKDLKIAKDYILWLEKNNIKVKKSFVFGSRAKGTAREDSDLDICVVSNSFGKDLHDERVLLMNLGMKISDLIEPHPMTMADFNNKYNPLALEVKKTGLPINC